MINIKSSFHGGHSGEFCYHAQGDLEELIESAIEQKISHYGISEHAPRYDIKHLYDYELEKNIGVSELIKTFDHYGKKAFELKEKYKSKINLIIGFEAEYFPDQSAKMLNLKSQYNFEYMVGSVHFVDDIAIDFSESLIQKLLLKYKTIENVSVVYFDYVYAMIKELKPDVVAHIDLIKKFTLNLGYSESLKVKEKILACLDLMKSVGGTLDFNFSQPRRGRNFYYPSPWIIEQALVRDVPLCFGDDSHAPEEVVEGIANARTYLLQQGVKEMVVFLSENGMLSRKKVSLL